MLQELKIKNFRSFRDEVILNFEATKDTTFDECHVVEVSPGIRLLRFALVYGANASGKSNLLKAVEFLRKFWFTKRDDMDESTEVIPFLLDRDTSNEPSQFEMKFWVGNVKYWYILSLNQKYVVSEKLYYYKSVQPTMLFQREMEKGRSVIKYNANIVKVPAMVADEISLKCLPNTSFFVARNRVNCTLPFIDEARDWMKNGFLPLVEPNTRMSDYAGRKMLEDATLRNYLLDFVHKADFNITGVNTEKESVPMPGFMRDALLRDDRLSKSDKEQLLSDPVVNHIHIEFEHTVKNSRGAEKYTMSNDLQSEGTRRTLGIEAAIYEALAKERFLSVDEIESSLHPELVEFILQQFLRKQNRSQMLISSHYDPLLNTIDDLIRKDSVWFTEKGEDGHTNLYSLVEFRGLNKISSFQRSYRNGVFGALPNILG